MKPLSEEGICVFDKKEKYFPPQMEYVITDHEWSLCLGFENTKERSQFLSDLKSIIRDYGYAQRSKSTSREQDKYDVRIPTAGTIQIYITEARNIPADRIRKELSKNSMRMIDNKLKVIIGFKGPKTINDLFSSAFVDETTIEKLETTLNNNHAVVEHELVANPSWSTEENPAGEMCNMGRLLKLPNTNVLLTISVGVTAIKNDIEHTCIFGSGEYFFLINDM